MHTVFGKAFSTSTKVVRPGLWKLVQTSAKTKAGSQDVKPRVGLPEPAATKKTTRRKKKEEKKKNKKQQKKQPRLHT